MGNPALERVCKAAKSLYPLITAELSAQSPKKYNNDAWTLGELDEWRNVTLPELLKKRHERKELHITKDELVLIMDWKLAKGKFRPTLPKLIKSNQKDDVILVTSAGLKIFMEFAELNTKWENVTLQEYQAVVKTSLKKLCELKGVGPATASLLLSLLNACTIHAPPFFSDEAFIYFIQEPLRPGTPIKYNVKEYVDEYVGTLFNIVASGPSISMDELEKGGWALKMYEIHRITKLADCKLPFETDDESLVKFPDTQKYQPVSGTNKRKVEKEKPRKRVKKN